MITANDHIGDAPEISGSPQLIVTRCAAQWLPHHANQALLSSTVARDSSGPLKASFLTMLLLEDTIAHAQHPFGICSGTATVTLHRFIDLDALSTDQLALAIANFASLNDVIFAFYLSPPIAEPLAYKRYSI